MKSFKYFSIRDSSREPLGIVKASNKTKAIDIAAGKKSLNVEEFLKLFFIEQIK